jgi:hypothetical protein
MLDLKQQAGVVVATPTPGQPDHWLVGIHH